MSKAVDDLKSWFNKLSEADQKDVVTFLYEGKVLVKKGLFVGPNPDVIPYSRGLHVGPAPVSIDRACPSCGRPF
jgi:hypothetical protein